MTERPESGNRHRRQNLRLANRLVRGGVAALMLALAAAAFGQGPSIWLVLCALLAVAVAVGLLATAVIGYCPVQARVNPDRDPKASGLIAAVAPEATGVADDTRGEDS